MPFTKLLLKPGVHVEETPLLNEASWSFSNLVRFFHGIIQKLGGWQRLCSTALVGTCRGIFAWADLSGNAYVACGTEQRLEVYTAGVLSDITPIRSTTNPTPALAFTNHSNLMQITDASYGGSVGDWIYLMTQASLTSQSFFIDVGFYQIATVIDVNNYTVTIPHTATSTASGDGATPEFTTTNTMSSVKVTLNNHGYTASTSVFTIEVPVTVGGITLSGSYIVQTIVDVNNFTITAASAATSSASAFENGGDLRMEYLLPTGLVSAQPAQGYGDGGYGLGGYGQGAASTNYSPLRQWSLGAWGQDLMASPTNGSLYIWNPSNGTSYTNPATLTSVNAPASMTGFFIAMPEQQVISYGAYNPTTSAQDPMLVRWCDVADYTDWTATAANQAGSYRLPRGSRIVGGIQGPQFGMLWTDLGLWNTQYVQPPLIYGFNELSEGCGLIAMRGNCVLGQNVFWMSYNGFFATYSGSVSPLPCDVWDELFGAGSPNINWIQQDKICMGANSHFNEFFTFYPSASGTGENDSYLKYNLVDNSWDYGSLIRTAWVDQSVFTGNNPMGVDGNDLIQLHESSNDADGSPLLATATTGWFKINDGQLYVFLERIITDFVLPSGSTVNIIVQTADYPGDTPITYGPYMITAGNTGNDYIIIRSRARLARIQISSSNDLGGFWRLGELLYMATPAGRR